MGGLTDTAIRAFKAKASRYEKPDSTAGLYLVVHPSGAKSWVVRFRAPKERSALDGQRASRKLTLGPLAATASRAVPEIGRPLSLTQARKLALDTLENVRHGIDPTVTRREEKAKAKTDVIADDEKTIDAAMVEFLKRYRGKDKSSPIRESTRRLTATYFGLRPDPEKPGEWIKTGRGALGKWAGKRLASITKDDVLTLLDSLVDAKHEVTANRTLTVLKTFFLWCMKNSKTFAIEASPAMLVDSPGGEKERDRVLTRAEIVAAWRAAETEGYPFGHLVQLAILTGARRDEMRNAPKREFELEGTSLSLGDGAVWNGPLWTLPAERAKNDMQHLVPLPAHAVELLSKMPDIDGSKLVFSLNGATPISGLSKAKKRIDAAMLAQLRQADPDCIMGRWTLHDLRRTFYTGLQSLGFSIEIADACVNHRSNIKGAARHYAHHQYLREKTAAFNAWAAHVDALVKGDLK